MNLHRIKFKDIEQIPQMQVRQNFKQDFFGTSPAPFIGRYGYPNVNIGVLSPQTQEGPSPSAPKGKLSLRASEDTSLYDSPHSWSAANMPIGKIASMRYELVNSRTQAHIKDSRIAEKFREICQEVGMAAKPVEMEIGLKRPPSLATHQEKEIIPFGPQAEVRKAIITSNPKVDTRVERIVRDTELKAAEGIMQLYKKGFEESALNKLLSVGNMGLTHNRKLVPTRWSITATDDTIGKQLITEIKDFPVGEYQSFFGGGWGNYYLLLFFPEVWSYELFETYLANPVNPWSKNGYAYSTDYEGYEGRKQYAEETAGGYYACRLPVLERMKQLKRQHACLALRFITPEYNVPLGVWVCREATRKSAAQKPLTFASHELLLQYAKEFITRKFGFNIDVLLTESKLLKNEKQQMKLSAF